MAVYNSDDDLYDIFGLNKKRAALSEKKEQPPKKKQFGQPTPIPKQEELTSEKAVRKLAAYFIGLLNRIPDDHQMFGDIQSGMVRMPRTNSRSNGQSWENRLRVIANTIINKCGPLEVGDNRCWLVSDTACVITGGKKTRIYRVLAFLKDPTETNWSLAVDTESGYSTTPFCHTCNRGQLRGDGQIGYCVNGIEHGFFGNREINETFKACTYGCFARCPGHGKDLVKCVFTKPDGTIAPCLMTSDHMPKCNCTICCY